MKQESSLGWLQSVALLESEIEASLGQGRQSNRERGGSRSRACSAIGTRILKDFPPKTISLLLEGKKMVILPVICDSSAARPAWPCSSHSSGLPFAPHSKTMPSSPLLSSLPSFLQGWFTLTLGLSFKVPSWRGFP